MAQPIDIQKLLPIYKVENDCLLSVRGDVTIAYEVTLPEIFTLSNEEYETFHQAWIKAIKILPRYSVFHKQDWFVADKIKANFEKDDISFLTRASERFFNERPFLHHQCYVLLTKKPVGRKAASSVYSNLLCRSMVPEATISPVLFQEFLDSAGQFERILTDSGFIGLRRLTDDELAGTDKRPGLLAQYLSLPANGEVPTLKDIVFKDGLKVGDNCCQLYTLADAENLPGMCGSRINYDKYCTDRTKFSVGFASVLGQLLSCNHIYNQYIFIDDTAKTLKLLEAKRRRLQSLSAYSRENAIARDATADFLNEAIASQRLPVKGHFNVLAWTDTPAELKDMRNQIASAMVQMDANPKQETDGAPQIFWAGLPGNEADFPMNDTFDWRF